MKIKKELKPALTKNSKARYLVCIWYNQRRFRYSSGNAIGIKLYPNQYPLEEREEKANLLLSAFSLEIEKGWRPENNKLNSNILPSVVQVCEKVYKHKLKLSYSDSYLSDLNRTLKLWKQFCTKQKISNSSIEELRISQIREFLFEYSSSSQSIANLKRNISALLKEEVESHGIVLNFGRIKLPKAPQQLHKPIDDVSALLSDINAFNTNLYLCCLMTYTMLLRPHREVRCLSFRDFNEDFTQVSLSGAKVKSKRNRVLPVPKVVRDEVLERFKGNRKDNVFTLNEAPYNRDYFKTLWSRYKNQSRLLEQDQTLYSFRHTGAIKVFEKTGSLQKLQQVMGHSDMKVSLTYLRGLEVKQLDVEDLPNLE